MRQKFLGKHDWIEADVDELYATEEAKITEETDEEENEE
jgi:hypothetical protein